MEYIISRSFPLPTIKEEMENAEWFNMWQRRNFPFSELVVGDVL